ncbi:MAG: AAA family ATPase [Phycisphaerales bacterium]|nr:AAA family ATPase [Phycisphaerales bacterium]
MAIDELVQLVLKPTQENWARNHQRILDSLFGSGGGRYPADARNALKLRAPEKIEIPYAAYIHPANPDSGAYGGMSLVFFPPDEWKGPCLVGMVVGTQGLHPDEPVLSRPGHARKVNAICSWLNHRRHGCAWAKHDPTRLDIRVPDEVTRRWPDVKGAMEKYGRETYALFRPASTNDGEMTRDAVLAFLDLLLEERGFGPLKPELGEAERIQAEWFAHIFPAVSATEVAELLQERRFVILQGPPGTGKTRMAKELLRGHKYYAGKGRFIQFHPNTTYENFIGGLAPSQDNNGLGLQFVPRRGHLMDAVAEAGDGKYLLVVDEMNRADLAKVLGEAIVLLEPGDPDREVVLPYDFSAPIGTRLRLPAGLHILGTMNTADRSIALVDIAIRRRFAFVDLWPDFRAAKEKGSSLSQEYFRKTVSLFVEHATEEAMPLVPGHAYFLAESEDEARRKLKWELVPLLREYLAQGFVAGFAENVRALIQEMEAL